MYADGPSGAVYVTDGLVATMRACFGIHGRACNQCVQRVRAMSKQDAGTHLLRRSAWRARGALRIEISMLRLPTVRQCPSVSWHAALYPYSHDDEGARRVRATCAYVVNASHRPHIFCVVRAWRARGAPCIDISMQLLLDVAVLFRACSSARCPALRMYGMRIRHAHVCDVESKPADGAHPPFGVRPLLVRRTAH